MFVSYIHYELVSVNNTDQSSLCGNTHSCRDQLRQEEQVTHVCLKRQRPKDERGQALTKGESWGRHGDVKSMLKH